MIGSRSLKEVHIASYLPKEITEIVSGGAVGVDTCAREYALAHGLILTEYLPDYERFGRSAPLKRNLQIIEYADLVLAFWDGRSRGTAYVIRECDKRGKECRVHRPRGLFL